MKIKLSICTKDRIYSERVLNFFDVHYNDKLELSAFSSAQSMLAYLSSNPVDVILFGIEMKEEIDLSKIDKSISISFLMEDHETGQWEGFKGIRKYQKAELIYKDILNICADKKTMSLGFKKQEGNVAVISVFLSANGGAGASTIANAFAIAMAKGKRVLYLNFEAYGDADLYWQGEGAYNFDEIIYGMKSKRGALGLKLESAVKQAAEGVYFYSPCQNPLDLMELSEEDIEKLFLELRSNAQYNHIVLDMSSSLKPLNQTLLKLADNIIMVHDGSETGCSKFTRFYTAVKVLEQQKGIQLRPKMLAFYNKFSNKSGREIREKEVPVIGGIPRFENITIHEMIKKISDMDVFTKLC